MNWTTTTVPLWQGDCDNYRRTGRPFEVRDVTTPSQREFLDQFAARHDLAVSQEEQIARFEKSKSKRRNLGVRAR
jgi:hypothetical protein